MTLHWFLVIQAERPNLPAIAIEQIVNEPQSCKKLKLRYCIKKSLMVLCEKTTPLKSICSKYAANYWKKWIIKHKE
jgi:hypothetical protein